MQISGRNITIINNYYYGGSGEEIGGKGNKAGATIKKTRTEKKGMIVIIIYVCNPMLN